MTSIAIWLGVACSVTAAVNGNAVAVTLLPSALIVFAMQSRRNLLFRQRLSNELTDSSGDDVSSLVRCLFEGQKFLQSTLDAFPLIERDATVVAILDGQ